MGTIYTSRTLVPGGDRPPLDGGALLAVGGQIAAVGSRAELRRSDPAARVLDFGDALMVPLLVNAHTHLELTDYPAWAEASAGSTAAGEFVDWILRLIEVKRGLDPEEYARSLERGIRACIAAGTGAVGDVLSHHPARAAYRDAPLRGALFLETLGQDPARILHAEKHLGEALRAPWDGLPALGLSPHSPYSISAAYMERVYRRCRRHGLRSTTHLAESPAEVAFLDGGRGELATRFYPAVGWGGFLPRAAHRGPVAYLEERGGLFPENLLVHGVQLTAGEIERLGQHRMHLALCARSNARLGVGRAPAGRLRAAGVQLSLGTDSRSSCESLSVWDELAFAATWFAGELDAPSLFRAATLGGARALGVERHLGSLSPGRDASFQVLRPERVPPPGELSGYLVAEGRAGEIDRVVVRGQPAGGLAPGRGPV